MKEIQLFILKGCPHCKLALAYQPVSYTHLRAHET